MATNARCTSSLNSPGLSLSHYWPGTPDRRPPQGPAPAWLPSLHHGAEERLEGLAVDPFLEGQNLGPVGTSDLERNGHDGGEILRWLVNVQSFLFLAGSRTKDHGQVGPVVGHPREECGGLLDIRRLGIVDIDAVAIDVLDEIGVGHECGYHLDSVAESGLHLLDSGQGVLGVRGCGRRRLGPAVIDVMDIVFLREGSARS
jgi:hypothetical protein